MDGINGVVWPSPPSTCRPPAAPTRPTLAAAPRSERKGLDEDLRSRERVLEGLGRDLSRGLNSVKRLTQELKLEDKVGWQGGTAGWWVSWGRHERDRLALALCRLPPTRAARCPALPPAPPAPPLHPASPPHPTPTLPSGLRHHD